MTPDEAMVTETLREALDRLQAENARLREALTDIQKEVEEAHDGCERNPAACSAYHSFSLGTIAATAWLTMRGILEG